MVSLADRIIKNKKTEGKSELKNDEYGINVPVPVNYDYICARILKRNPGLYMKDGYIYDMDGGYINETYDEMVRLSNYVPPSREFRKAESTLVWNRMREILPLLGYDKLRITDKMVWNKVSGDIEYDGM